MPQGGFDAGTGWVGMTKPAETSLIFIARKKLSKRGTCALDRATMWQNRAEEGYSLTPFRGDVIFLLDMPVFKNYLLGRFTFGTVHSGEVMC